MLEKQLKQLVDLTDFKNQHIIPAITNSEPVLERLKSLQRPVSELSEAYYLCFLYSSRFMQTLGSVEYLKILYQEVYGREEAGRNIKDILEDPYKQFDLMDDINYIYESFGIFNI